VDEGIPAAVGLESDTHRQAVAQAQGRLNVMTSNSIHNLCFGHSKRNASTKLRLAARSAG
jgi:hypothetical protein